MSESALLTDLYQLTMLQGYFDQGMRETAVFEFFVRKLPERRNFLVAALLEQALDYLEQVAFTEEELAWLASHGRFSADFLADLAHFRFIGDVDAVPEGTLIFPEEPLLRVIAPLPEAQWVKSRLPAHRHLRHRGRRPRLGAVAPGPCQPECRAGLSGHYCLSSPRFGRSERSMTRGMHDTRCFSRDIRSFTAFLRDSSFGPVINASLK